jgi:hypothetical protein
MKGIGEDRFQAAEVLYFIETIVIAEDEAEDRADRERREVKSGVGVGGGEELFHVCEIKDL